MAHVTTDDGVKLYYGKPLPVCRLYSLTNLPEIAAVGKPRFVISHGVTVALPSTREVIRRQTCRRMVRRIRSNGPAMTSSLYSTDSVSSERMWLVCPWARLRPCTSESRTRIAPCRWWLPGAVTAPTPISMKPFRRRQKRLQTAFVQRAWIT